MQCRTCGCLNQGGRLYCAECGATLGHFVGRAREVQVLQGAVADALSGQGRLVLLAGEPGIGKTRTAEELAAHARRLGAEVLWGRCFEGQGAPAFWPWVQALRAYVRAHDGQAVATAMRSAASDIAQIVPELRERLPDLPQPLALEPEQARFRLFDSVSGFLHRIVALQPLLLVLDDLHLADKPSLLLLQFIVANLGGARLFLLGTYRHTEVGRHHPLSETLGELARHSGTERLVLRGLAEAEVGRL